jgi:hypothetical protein
MRSVAILQFQIALITVVVMSSTTTETVTSNEKPLAIQLAYSAEAHHQVS